MYILWKWNGMLTYVDDCIFFGRYLQKIDKIIARLKEKFDLTVDKVKNQDKDVFVYLGVDV